MPGGRATAFTGDYLAGATHYHFRSQYAMHRGSLMELDASRALLADHCIHYNQVPSSMGGFTQSRQSHTIAIHATTQKTDEFASMHGL